MSLLLGHLDYNCTPQFNSDIQICIAQELIAILINHKGIASASLVFQNQNKRLTAIHIRWAQYFQFAVRLI